MQTVQQIILCTMFNIEQLESTYSASLLKAGIVIFQIFWWSCKSGFFVRFYDFPVELVYSPFLAQHVSHIDSYGQFCLVSNLFSEGALTTQTWTLIMPMFDWSRM